MPSLCVFGKPYIRGFCDPDGRIASYIHFGIRSALTKSNNRFLKARFNVNRVVIAGDWTEPFKFRMIIKYLLLLLLVTRPLPRDGGMAEDHGAPEAGQLPRVWTRRRSGTESCQRVSGEKSP